MRHCNQYKCKHGKDIGSYMIGFLYLMILMTALHDGKLILTPTHIDAQENQSNMLTPVADPAESKQVVVQVATPAATLKPITRAEKLKLFLEKKNSPLANYADYIVKLSDEYDISYTLISSISGKESSFGNAIKPGSYNAWGIMAWDEKGVRHIREFKSWKESIKFEVALLSKNYRENMNRAIQEKYCPSFECSDTWTLNVTGFQQEINN